MRIKAIDKRYTDNLEVYGIYELSRKLYYIVHPNNYEGLLVMKNDEVEVIDNSINDFVFEFKEEGIFICSKIIEDNDFRDRLLECDPTAYSEFLIKIAKTTE